MGLSSEHFSEAELSCKCGCGLNNIKPELLDALEDLRRRYGRKMRVNSASRCWDHNYKVKGHIRSAHMTGEAVDIHVPHDIDRHTMLSIILRLNLFSGIGIAKTFIHLDVKKRVHSRPVVFTY